MKATKKSIRILSGTLASICLLGTSLNVMAADLSEENLSDLKAFGIMQGDPDGNMRLDNTITRAEAIKMLCTAQATEEEIKAEKISDSFPDVTEKHWAYPYVCYAKAKGIVEGDENGNFNPEADITYEEIIKAVVCMVGYEPFADMNGGYPGGYKYAADRYNMTKGVNLKANKPAVRSDVAALILNSLDVPLMIKNGDADAVEYAISEQTLRQRKS